MYLDLFQNLSRAYLQIGYHLKALGDYSFSCQKLSQIVVHIHAGEGAEKSLPSVLLSLSGEDGYRNNAITSPGEAFNFDNLFPGSFFLRPLMKVFLRVHNLVKSF
jgi:hypothetical protein